MMLARALTFSVAFKKLWRNFSDCIHSATSVIWTEKVSKLSLTWNEFFIFENNYIQMHFKIAKINFFVLKCLCSFYSSLQVPKASPNRNIAAMATAVYSQHFTTSKLKGSAVTSRLTRAFPKRKYLFVKPPFFFLWCRRTKSGITRSRTT